MTKGIYFMGGMVGGKWLWGGGGNDLYSYQNNLKK